MFVNVHMGGCLCNRKLHKDEICRQKEKALNNTNDTDSGSDMEIDNGFSVPGRIWNKLYRYVKPVSVFCFWYDISKKNFCSNI